MSKVTPSTEISYRTSPELRRVDCTVESEPGIAIFVRAVVDPKQASAGVPIILLHGARASSLPSFDLDVPGGSLAGDLARAGHAVYLMDARGYGGSTRPDAMSQSPDSSAPLTRSEDVLKDIAAVVAHVCSEQGAERVALMGWATGSQWLAHYAAVEPDRASDLILYNSLWPVAGAWSIGDALEDPERPGELRDGALGGYGFATAVALLGRWEQNIPIDDLDAWRDPSVAAAYARAAIDADPTASQREPESARTPLGALADSFALSRGARLFDPAAITARVLILRSELDFWSRPIDFDQPLEDLTGAEHIERVEIPNATHFVHLDRAQRGRDVLLESVLGFLSAS